jgi:hypothetical protein
MNPETQLLSQVTHSNGHNIIGGLSRVIHCNFYNAYLQMTVLLTQGAGDNNPERLLTDSVTPLIHLLQQSGYTHNDLLSEFSYCGFGILKQLNENTWETPRSHYGEAICIQGKPAKSCFFTSGYLQGLLNKRVIETACKIDGAENDKFSVQGELPEIENYLSREFELQTNIPERSNFDTRIDEDKIITTVRTLPLYGSKENGLIEAFGAVLTNHFADYYNRISYESYFALRDAGIPDEDSKEMFIQAGHVCAFNTFGRVMKSPEWYQLVVPMCDTKEDWFHGMIAVINTFGWGIYRVEKLDPAGETIVRVYNSYEGVGYRRMYPKSDDKILSFLAMGAVLGLIHLLWKIDIREKPELTREFYVEQYNNAESSYIVVQTHAIAAGDEYDRIIVSK